MPKKKDEPEEWMLSLTVGHNYLFTDSTSMIYVGKLEQVIGPHTVILSGAAWVSETGRLHMFMANGKADGIEVEPIGIRCVHWVGWNPWPHTLFEKAQ